MNKVQSETQEDFCWGLLGKISLLSNLWLYDAWDAAQAHLSTSLWIKPILEMARWKEPGLF